MIKIKLGRSVCNASQIIFDATLVVWTVFSILFNYTTISTAVGRDLTILLYYVDGLAIVFLLFKLFFFTRYQSKELIIIFFILGTTFMTYLQSSSRNMFILALFIIASKDIELRTTFRTMYKANLVLLCSIIFCSMIGVLPNNITGRESIRSCLGFIHPNNYGAMIINVTLLIFFCNWENMKLRHWFIIIGLFCIDVMYPKSKTAYYIIILAILLYFATRKYSSEWIKSIFRVVLKWSPVIILIATIALTYMYIRGDFIAITINKILTTRIYQMTYYWQTYSVTLFGQHLNTVSSFEANSLNAMHALDNSYLNILLGSGVIIFILIVGSLLYLVVKATKMKNYKIACIIACVFFWGFMETSIYKVEFNVIVLLLQVVLYNQNYFIKEGKIGV